MILKEFSKDSKKLTALRKELSSAIGKQKESLEVEISKLQAGLRTENDAAFTIDSHYRHSTDVVILHGINIKLPEGSAQIDHLLINRALDCFVFETKSRHASIKINDYGEFEFWNKFCEPEQFVHMDSPIAQNLRHVAILRDRVKMSTHSLISSHVDSFNYVPYILFSKHTKIERPQKFDTSMVIKTESLAVTLDKRIICPASCHIISSLDLFDIGNEILTWGNIKNPSKEVKEKSVFTDQEIAKEIETQKLSSDIPYNLMKSFFEGVRARMATSKITLKNAVSIEAKEFKANIKTKSRDVPREISHESTTPQMIYEEAERQGIRVPYDKADRFVEKVVSSIKTGVSLSKSVERSKITLQ